MDGSRALGHFPAGDIAGGDDDFQTVHACYRETEITEKQGGCAGGALLEAGGANPVAQIAETVDPVQMVQTATACNGAVRIINDEVLKAKDAPFGNGLVDPKFRIGPLVVWSESTHPWGDVSDGFAGGFENRVDIAGEVGADGETSHKKGSM